MLSRLSRRVRPHASLTLLASVLLLLTIGCGGGITPPPEPATNGNGNGSFAQQAPAGYVYVGGAFQNSDNNGIAAFAVASDGSLQPLPGSPFTTPAAMSMTADLPDGLLFSINYKMLASQAVAGDGAITAGSVLSGAFSPGVSIDQSGRTLYVPSGVGANGPTSGSLNFFSIGTNGALHTIGSIPNGGGGTPLFAPDDVHAYASVCPFVPSMGTSWSFAAPPYLLGYVRNSDGSLTATETKVTAPTNYCAQALAFSPDGKLLAAAFNYNAIVQRSSLGLYAVGADGSLSPLPGSPYSMVAAAIYGLVFDPTGQFLIAAESDGLSVYQFAPGSAPVQVKGSPVGGSMQQVVLAAGTQLVFGLDNPAGLFVYKLNGGTLVPAPGSPHRLPVAPWSLAVVPVNQSNQHP